MVEERVVKITCTVHRALSKTVSDVLASLGIPEVYSMKGKYLSLKESPAPSVSALRPLSLRIRSISSVSTCVRA
jgi:hypothetical protein